MDLNLFNFNLTFYNNIWFMNKYAWSRYKDLLRIKSYMINLDPNKSKRTIYVRSKN